MAAQCVAVGNGRCYSGFWLRSSVDFIAFARLETHSPCVSGLRCSLSALRKTTWLRYSRLTFNVHFPPFLFLFPLNPLWWGHERLHVSISLDWTTQRAFWWSWVFSVLFLSGIQILRHLVLLPGELHKIQRKLWHAHVIAWFLSAANYIFRGKPQPS